MRLPSAWWLLIFTTTVSGIAQQAQTTLPNPPTSSTKTGAYSPLDQKQRFVDYARKTYSLGTLLEAGAHAGIEQARSRPSGWPEGGAGYADRLGSAAGEIVIRRTTEYALADLFREDIRRQPCASPCSTSRFRLAFEDSFLARRGDDGHEALSVAKLAGPVAGGAVAVRAWYPADARKGEAVREVGLNYGFVYARNLIHEFVVRR